MRQTPSNPLSGLRPGQWNGVLVPEQKLGQPVRGGPQRSSRPLGETEVRIIRENNFQRVI